MQLKSLLVVLIVLISITSQVFAQENKNKGDTRFIHQLDRLGLKYTITDKGNFSLSYSLDNGRSQVAYITGTTEKLDNMEVMELWSRAGTFDGLPPQDVMQSLLVENGTKQIGHWSIEQAKDSGYIVYFATKIPVYIGDADLNSILRYVADIADQKEEELFKIDDE